MPRVALPVAIPTAFEFAANDGEFNSAFLFVDTDSNFITVLMRADSTGLADVPAGNFGRLEIEVAYTDGTTSVVLDTDAPWTAQAIDTVADWYVLKNTGRFATKAGLSLAVPPTASLNIATDERIATDAAKSVSGVAAFWTDN